MDMRAGDDETRLMLRKEFGKSRDEPIGQFRGELRDENRQVCDDLRGEIGQLRACLSEEIKAVGDRLEAAIQEWRNYSRVMFEEVIERIDRIGDGSRRRPRRKS